jgi:O-antigen ligase
MTFDSRSSAKRFWQIGILIFFLTCFVLVSRILDVTGKGGLPTILLGLLGITLAVSPRRFVFLTSAAGKIMPVFAAWVVLAFFMSPHGSNGVFHLRALLEGALLFAAAAGLLATAADFGKLFISLACGGLAAAFLSLVWSTHHGGRIALRGGPYADANYYAMWLMVVAPLIWTAFARKPLWTRLLGGAATAIPVLVALRTGSRAGIVSLGVMALVLFVLAPLGTRILIATVAAAGAVALVAFVPDALKTRLAPSAQTGADTDSSRARQTMFATSLVVTLSNPLFGVGPGNFPFFVVEQGKAEGMDWAPLATHNAYTQVSSETGIPGAILFLLLIGFSVKNAISLVRQSTPKGAAPDDEIHRLARGLLVSLAALLTAMFFLSEGYNMMVLLWLGMTAGLRQIQLSAG